MLHDVGLPEGQVLSGLLGFNLGVEFGQLYLYSRFYALRVLLQDLPSPEFAGRIYSSILTGYGVFLFVQRGLRVAGRRTRHPFRSISDQSFSRTYRCKISIIRPRWADSALAAGLGRMPPVASDYRNLIRETDACKGPKLENVRADGRTVRVNLPIMFLKDDAMLAYIFRQRR
ncbi:MAG: hypothetical protein CM15mP55_0960 [Hyphomicrobiales bacterium]|nr:MAG: hypothetical protein CM15mP55_0960 [Hyphomicrobiales bacterium]